MKEKNFEQIIKDKDIYNGLKYLLYRQTSIKARRIVEMIIDELGNTDIVFNNSWNKESE